MGLFVFDLDGTLIDHTYKLQKEEIEALNLLYQNGHQICFCSGRPYAGIRAILNEANFDKFSYIISSNGGIITDSSGSIVFEKYLGSAAFFDVFDEFGDDEDLTILCYSNNKIGYVNHYEIIHLEELSNRIDSFKMSREYLDPLIKIMIRTGDKDAYKIVVPQRLLDEYEVAVTNYHWIEFNVKGINKGNAIDYVRNLLNVDSKNVYFFGDSGNDLEGIKKFNGIAMGNADEEVKKHAKYVTKSIYEHGVPYALKEILKVI